MAEEGAGLVCKGGRIERKEGWGRPGPCTRSNLPGQGPIADLRQDLNLAPGHVNDRHLIQLHRHSLPACNSHLSHLSKVNLT